jgi:holo-[acyl-carrier protein] synthase
MERQLAEMAAEVGAQRIGVDAVYLPSWGRYLEVGGEGFLHRVYTPLELAQAEGEEERLASRFAGKEAVLKVLGSGIAEVGMGSVEIFCEDSGRPRVRLYAAAAGVAEELSLSALEVSLCHEQDYALAVATAAEGSER